MSLIPTILRGRRLTSEDEKVRMDAAKAWSIWEGTTSK
jgi:proline iminopeptidase